MIRSYIRRGATIGAAVLILGGLSAGVVLSENAHSALPAALAQTPAGGMQPGGPQHGGRGGRMGQVLQSLGLSDAQKQQIRSIMSDARQKNENLTDQDQRRANMRAAFTQIHDKVLTPAQRQQFDQKMQAMRRQHEQGGQGH